MFAVGTDGAWRVATPRLPFVHPLSGAGDAVSALFTGHYLRTRGDVAAALGLVAGAVYAVLAATVARRRRELALVAAQDALLDPPTRFTVTQVD
jgi:pyridoxine kinase